MATIFHCSYCLMEVSATDLKRCGKCHRRAYCSKDCQVEDWKTKFPADKSLQRGQGHKNWCGLVYGEEDVDWKVAPVEGKGLGVIALRDIPAWSRIMVDACQMLPTAHPQTKMLMPEGESLAAKFNLNGLGIGEESDFDTVLCLRLARVNHSCRSNADHVYFEKFGVKVLFSEKDIKEGEEITINYTVWNDISKGDTILKLNKKMLVLKWGIRCPDDCICRDTNIEAIIERSHELDQLIPTAASTGQHERAMRAVKQLLANYDVFGAALMNRKRTLYDGFQVGITHKSTTKDGFNYLRQLHRMVSRIFHPEDEYLRKCEGWLKDPKSHRNFSM